MDRHTAEQRSFNMSQIRSRNTKPEVKLRKELYAQKILGYRLNAKIIGKPDIYYPKYKLAVFVDGCFWHKCKKCYVQPRARKDYWINKIENNHMRDKKVNSILMAEGYSVVRIWEHQIKEDFYGSVERIKRKLLDLESSLL